MLHDVVQRKKFYTLVLQKCLTRSEVVKEVFLLTIPPLDLPSFLGYNAGKYNL